MFFKRMRATIFKKHEVCEYLGSHSAFAFTTYILVLPRTREHVLCRADDNGRVLAGLL